jgi:hypothetical protein
MATHLVDIAHLSATYRPRPQIWEDTWLTRCIDGEWVTTHHLSKREATPAEEDELDRLCGKSNAVGFLADKVNAVQIGN